MYNEVSDLLKHFYDEGTTETIMANDYNDKFFGIVDKLKGELADNIYSSLCNLKNLSEDDIEI